MPEQKTTEQKEIRYLVRVANTDLDGNQSLHNALLSIRGVSYSFANMICTFSGIDKRAKTGYLSDAEVAKLTDIVQNPVKYGAPSWILNRRRDYDTTIDKHLILADIAFVQENDIKRLKRIKSYRGIRHSYGQPTRGQRTRSNFRKNKGKVHLGVQRKKIEAPAGEKKDDKKDNKKGGKK